MQQTRAVISLLEDEVRLQRTHVVGPRTLARLIGFAFACLVAAACSGADGSASGDLSPTSPSSPGPQAPPGGGTGGGGTSPGSSTTGMRTTYCAAVDTLSNTAYVTMPRLGGLDVKLFYQPTFQYAGAIFRNRYQDSMHFAYEVYRSGINPAPSTTCRQTLGASREEGGSLSCATADVPRGGQACVVVDRVRFGASDTGPYFNP